MSPVSAPPTERPRVANLLSGVLGGLVVLVAGALLIATDVIDTGETTREVVRQAPISRPAAGDGDRGGQTVSDIYRGVGPGVVFVEARGVASRSPFGLPQEREGNATASGFVINEDGLVLTNAHAVEGADEVAVRFTEDGDPVDAKLKGRDPSTDLALLEVNPDDAKLRPVPLGNSKEVRVGDPVVAIGNPFGFTRTVTTGIVSALQRQIEAPNGFPIRNVIQTDASINPGNSGGPLLDSDGRVIGINSQIATGGSSGSVGIGFAVPINTAKSLLPQLRKEGRIERSYLGIEMTGVTKQIAEDLNLPVDAGALINRVVKGGPADKAGLRAGRTLTGEGIRAGGDLLVEVDGKRISDPDDVADAIADNDPGDEVEVEFFRGDDRKTAKVKLGKRPNSLQLGPDAPGAPGAPESPDDNCGLFPFP
jgi:S1-C subfamily serine protease